jgi:hypothetical protein
VEIRDLAVYDALLGDTEIAAPLAPDACSASTVLAVAPVKVSA